MLPAPKKSYIQNAIVECLQCLAPGILLYDLARLIRDTKENTHVTFNVTRFM